MISLQSSGSFKKTESYLSRLLKNDIKTQLQRFGQEGVTALSQATPKDSGKAASSWSYSVEKTRTGYELVLSTVRATSHETQCTSFSVSVCVWS